MSSSRESLSLSLILFPVISQSVLSIKPYKQKMEILKCKYCKTVLEVQYMNKCA